MSDIIFSLRIIFGSGRNPRFCDVIGKWLLVRPRPPVVSALVTMMNTPGWWAHVLKQARSATPCREA